jgi:hypothetical protein
MLLVLFAIFQSCALMEITKMPFVAIITTIIVAKMNVCWPILHVSRLLSDTNHSPGSQLMIEDEECRILGCGAVWNLCKLTFRRNVSTPSSG